jgi:hypothetical protein
MSAREVFNVLEGELDKLGYALTKSNEGDSPANKDGMTAFAFKDTDGNLVLPQLNPEGALPVTLDAGTTKRARGKVLAGGVTLNTRTLVASIPLTAEKIYNKLSAIVTCSRFTSWEVVYVDDDGGTPTEEILLDGLTGAGAYTAKLGLEIDQFDTIGGTGNQVIKVYAKIEDNKTSDLMASVSVNEIA